MSGERSHQRDAGEHAHAEGANTPTGRYAHEALRALARILARQAAQELFEKSRVSLDTSNNPEDGRP